MMILVAMVVVVMVVAMGIVLGLAYLVGDYNKKELKDLAKIILVCEMIATMILIVVLAGILLI